MTATLTATTVKYPGPVTTEQTTSDQPTRGVIYATDIAKARVSHPAGKLTGSFFFFRGAAAVWTIDSDLKTAKRVLYIPSGAEFVRRRTARFAHEIRVDGQVAWRIEPRGGGGCNCEGNPLAAYTLEQLTSPGLETVGI